MGNCSDKLSDVEILVFMVSLFDEKNSFRRFVVESLSRLSDEDWTALESASKVLKKICVGPADRRPSAKNENLLKEVLNAVGYSDEEITGIVGSDANSQSQADIDSDDIN